MATESPVVISGSADRWQVLKNSPRYRPSTSEMAIEGLDFLTLKDQRSQSFVKDMMPNRSESAPPSMEGSLAAMENIVPHRKINFTFYPGSSPPSISDVNGENAKLSRNKLPAHVEEPEDDQSCNYSSIVPVEKSGFSGYHSRSLDSMQDTNQRTNQSPSTAGAGHVDSVHTQPTTSANACSDSNSNSQNLHTKEQLGWKNNELHQRAPPQDISTSRVQASSSQIIYPAITHAYSSLNQLHHIPSNTSMPYSNPHSPLYHNVPQAGFFVLQYGSGGYNLNSTVLPSYLAGYPHQGSAFPVAFNSAPFYGRVGVPLQLPFHVQYFQPPLRDPYGSYSHFYHEAPRDGANQMGSCDSKKESQQLSGSGYNNLNLRRGNVSGHYYGSPTSVGPFGQFPDASVVHPAMQPQMAAVSNTSLSHFSSGNPSRISGQSQIWKDAKLNYFLEELKSGNCQKLELSDIEGYIVEFSVDQHGSRFIQQKLLMCSLEEKASVFKEVVPHASKLITDLFEHGNSEERMNLADQLRGQILPLSLQMYGCRVIQKALDVINLEQKTRLVQELDGHVLRCVRDQNGNHVIQKCIESIPLENIHFMVSSFRGQVASLSMHPYGCRVIQRFLEHCSDNVQTKFIFNEILDSVCSLAQDQYGNYVTQSHLFLKFLVLSFRLACGSMVSDVSSKVFLRAEMLGDLQKKVVKSRQSMAATQGMAAMASGATVSEVMSSEVDVPILIKEIVLEVGEQLSRENRALASRVEMSADASEGDESRLLQVEALEFIADRLRSLANEAAELRGKPHERSRIIEKLVGSIVQLSQHKFASNVVEKCVEYSDSDARERLIKEIIGDGDKNDNLLVMMKDQYANYVIQRILEKCSNDHREVLLSQIKNHLTVLKKYTYGKHIVSRFEKLYAYGDVLKYERINACEQGRVSLTCYCWLRRPYSELFERTFIHDMIRCVF
ncbi:pumilio-like protein [Striga asiatica]|uniref:Pumilio-like protein n=1 Tax=Striga asiatica TaxID=4170 RepID=A0A5A7QQZ3_STRAF|nr:pumilio-like protein [Striga asiatica]